MHNRSASLVIEFSEDSNWLGGSIYIENLLSTLALLPVELRPCIQLQFLSSPKSAIALRLRDYPMVHVDTDNAVLGEAFATLRRIHRGILRRYPSLNRLTWTTDKKLFFPAFDTAQRWRKNLYWIPDFQHHHLPDLFSADDLERRNQRYEAIARADGILLLSSQAALADFRTYYPNAIIEPRVWSFCSHVNIDPASDCRNVLTRHDLPDKFLYVANQFWKHKDHATLFEALRLLREKGVEIPLVCTGKQEDPRNPEYFPVLQDSLIRQNMAHVRFLGVIPRNEQVQLFRSAAAIVQPSRFEGWSTVIEDAKALGRPVIATDIDVHREQLLGVSNAHLFRTSDAAHLAERIAELWTDLVKGPDLTQEAAAAEENAAKRLTSAHRFMAIIEEAMAYSQHAE